MAYTKLGRIRPVYSGEWNSGRAYTALEMVRTSDGGLSYIAQKDVPAGTPLSNGEYWAVVLDVREVLEAAKNASDRVDAVMDVKANALAASAVGNPSQIHPDKDSLIKPILTFRPIQKGSGEPSPENIRPITGRAGAELVRCGKNLLPFMMIGNTYAQSGMNAVVTDEGMVLNGTPLGAYNNLLHFVYSNLPAGTYTISGGDPATGVYAQMNITRADGTVQYYANAPFVIYGDEQRVVCFIQNSSVIPTMTNYVLKAQLELGSTATSFEPYQGDTFALDFGQTVYGGKVDVNKGELVVDWAKVTLPSSANWVKSISAKNGYYLGDGNIFVPQKLYMCPVLCNVAKYTSDVEEYKANYGMVYSDSTISLNVDPAVCGSTLESFKSWLDSTEVQIAYKLANPITIRLTPQQITALAGVNTVYGDVDEITAHYNKSLNAALEELKNAILAMGGNV